jgi:nicotinate-nucleotide pyrophosphorylase (carboxylating)
LKDDCPAFDIGGYVVGESQETAVLLAKTKTVLVGLPFFDAVFEELGCTVEWLRTEGEVLEPPARIAYVRGKCRNILLGERTALNILSRASGIGALARQFSDAAKSAGWHGEIAGTRKVTPGFRLVEKYALLAGGVSTHRMDLSQMVMLKVRRRNQSRKHCWPVACSARTVQQNRCQSSESTALNACSHGHCKAAETCLVLAA